MTDRTHDWQRILATAAVATVLIVASCEAPRPEPLAPRTSGSPAIVQPDETALDESQVEKPVMLESGTEMPKYPEILRRAGVEGEVLVSFVVNEQGTVEAETFKVIRSTHELFATAVKKALAGMRFAAAEAGGRKVKQVVEQPFSFSLPGLDRKSEGVEEVVKAGGKRLAFAVRQGQGAAASWEEKQVPSTIILRGAHSRDLSASPLLIVDGVIIKGEMKEIDPEMIESIEVVKGAAALSAYGAGAQNGVIRITTKARRRVP